MSPEESLKICRLAKALSPAQAVDEYTPDAWALILQPHRYVDAEQALLQLGSEQEWIHVSHIVTRIKRIRSDRVREFGPFEPPAEIDQAVTDGDMDAYREWYAGTVKAIADGTIKPERSAVAVIGHAERRDALLGSAPMRGADDD